MANHEPILIQLSARRYVVVFPSWPITGGTAGGVQYRHAEVRFGPADYGECLDWIASLKVKDPTP